jgi:signal transduction histidine kinase
LGTLIEGVLLSFALSDRINLLSQEKERVEHEAMLAQQTFSKRLIQAQEKERETFSNTMHDSIGHGLLVLKQNLDKIVSAKNGGQYDTDSNAKPSLQSQVEFCGEILHDVRRVSHDLHPHLLERLGLKSAIESTMERAFSTGDYEWQADIGNIPAGIDKNLEITIYRVIQESLNNILKHAGASEIILSLSCDSDSLEVNIKDDGNGFDLEELPFAGLGLHEMKDRIELFGGRFTIESSKEIGTHISFRVPVG